MSFIRLVGYYRRFNEGSSNIVAPYTRLTQRKKSLFEMINVDGVLRNENRD